MLFSYHEGQRDYLARIATLDSALVAADTGTGKSLMAITLAQLKLGIGSNFKGRCLICAPQNTTRSSRARKSVDNNSPSPTQDISQWKAEIHRFAPRVPVFEIQSRDDIGRIMVENKCHNGELPDGIYLTYYEAMFRNGAKETIPATWDTMRLIKELRINNYQKKWVYHVTCTYDDPDKDTQNSSRDASDFEDLNPETLQIPYRERIPGGWATIHSKDQVPAHDYTAGIGESRNGIRCILSPCLATELDAWCALTESGRECAWDMACFDEIHCITNMEAAITRQIIRCQPRYRWGFTATPISNIVTDIFPIMGWINVPHWHKGNLSNPRWPYTLEQINDFNETFLTEERDHTQEDRNQRASRGKWRGKCVKTSPVIAAPAMLLKIITNSMGFIDKKSCNPDYQAPTIHDIRVPMSTEQSKLYSYWMDPNKIKCKNAWQRAGIQISHLREIAAAPAHVKFGGPTVTSNLTPKIITGLELIAECLERREQVVCISSRIALTDTLQRYLTEAIGTQYISRIDSKTGAKNAQDQSNRFKRKQTWINLMGIKCAAGHSYHRCPNEIIFSIEYSYGPFHQAKGRIDRVNSEKPGRIYCLLHEGSIEETMFERCATKEDAARICLHGERLPRDFKPLDMGEILASHLETKVGHKTIDQEACHQAWPALKERLQKAMNNIIKLQVKRDRIDAPSTPSKGTTTTEPTPSKIIPFPSKTQPELPLWLQKRIQERTCN